MKKSFERNYYIGLDIGTDSVGYAVTDTDYRLLKFKGEPMIGTHLFESGNPAADRRAFRTARRRTDRRKQRIRLVQELFAKEISKVDINFFRRIRESALLTEDKTNADDPNCLFYDDNFSDKEFHKKYPTIHHLICDLVTTTEKRDVRLIYIACAWLVAHRGHFLSEIDGDSLDELTDIEPLYKKFLQWFQDRGIPEPWKCEVRDFEAVLNKKCRISEKENALKELLLDGKIPKEDSKEYDISIESLIKLFSGAEIQVKKIFISDTDLLENTDKISFRMDEEIFEAILTQLGEYAELLIVMKNIHDCVLLKELQKGRKNISEAKVAVYEKHRNDLAKLKYLVKKYAAGSYDELFRTGDKVSYSSYVGNYKSMKEGAKRPGKLNSPDELYKKIRKIFSELDESLLSKEDAELLDTMNRDMDLSDFLPKQVVTNNRIIPQQLYYGELKKILATASEHCGFLNEKADDGLTVTDKLLTIFRYRIPYFVGPLNSASKYSWLVRKNEGKILPWNIKEMVDYDKSEQAFIARMTNKCTYLPGEDVLPRWSVLYSKYTVLNEINNLKIDGKNIPVEVKKRIFNDLFLKNKKVTLKRIREYLLANGFLSKATSGNIKETLSGIDKEIKSSVKALVEFRRLLDTQKLSLDDVEVIVKHSTYIESKERFRKWIEKNFDLREEDINYVSNLKYSDFGRLSEKLLNGIEGANKETGEVGTVMHFLWETNDNLMEIIADKNRYTFNKLINEERAKTYCPGMTLNERLDSMGISNAVKRPIIRTMDIVSDIVKANGKEALRKIFVEMARGTSDDERGKRTKSRKTQLEEFYKKIKDEDSVHLLKQLEKMGDFADRNLQSQKLYLYYLQMGKCMYCGKPVLIEELNNTAYCDIDHVWPRSYVKDDSILNNKVLVHSEENGEKGDSYPLPAEWRSRMRGFWDMLHDMKSDKTSLLGDTKYNRLIRNYGFSKDEKQGFINRQLVETRQATKAVTELFKQKYPKTEIVFVKAGLVSDFRHEYGDIKEKAFGLKLSEAEKRDMQLVKCRTINDLHHAKDAYLNIVVGNVYDAKFTKKYFNIETDRYSMNDRVIFGTPAKNKEIWEPKKHLYNIDKAMNNNHIHLTKYLTCQKGGFFDQMPVTAGDKLIPRKKELETKKYGGYNKPSASFFTLVRYKIKDKFEITFIPVNLLVAERFKNDEQYSLRFVQDYLGSKANEIEFLTESRVLKINTIFSLDGFNVAISGKANGGKLVLLRSLESLFLDSNSEKYIKKIENITKKREKNIKYIIDEHFDSVSKEENEKLYSLLSDKIGGELYSKQPGAQIKLGNEEQERFKNLALEEQIKVLNNLVLYLKSNRAGTCDLSQIGKKSGSGAIYRSANMSNWEYSDIRIINRSASGLFENKSRNLKELL